MSKIYAILGRAMSPFEFMSVVAPRLTEIIEDSKNRIILSDMSGVATLTAKYLSQRGFRACTVYHIGDEPRHMIGGYNLKGGYDSYADIEASMRQ
jgi:hypothetical protein